MGAKDKNKSLLEIAVELFREKTIHGPEKIVQIAKYAMERKGLKTSVGKELLPQFIADLMESGYFIYCGNGLWNLKEFATKADLDREINEIYTEEEAEEAKKHELGNSEGETSSQENEPDEDDNNENDEDSDFNLEGDGVEGYEGESKYEDGNISIADLDLDEKQNVPLEYEDYVEEGDEDEEGE